MSLWRPLLTCLVVTLFAVGGVVRAAPMAETAPCHEPGGHETKDHGKPDKPRPAAAGVNCCVGCMPAPSVSEPVADAAPGLERVVLARATEDVLTSRALEPEPRPPRAHA